MTAVFIAEENILFHASAKDREEAVRLAGDILVNNGSANGSYVDAMVEMSEKFRYIVLAKGVAMPHARPESGALGNCLCLVKLREAVAFGHPENDPVSLVFGLVAVNEREHIDVMEALAELLEEEETIRRMIRTESKEQLLEIIREAEQKKAI